MLLVVITFILVAVGVLAYIYGAWKLSRYAARVSGGLSMGVLLFPPVAFWFAFYKLEQEGKEFPTTMWLFGIVSTILLTIVFWTPISYTLTGRMGELEAPSGVAEAAVAAHGIKAEDSVPTEMDEPAPTPEPAPAATNNAVAATNGATNAANAGTNGAAAGTNNAATNGGAATAAATAGAAQ